MKVDMEKYHQEISEVDNKISVCNKKNSHSNYSVDLPYPPVKVDGKNMTYANILSNDFAGRVSEFSAISQYINHELRITVKDNNVAEAIKKISMVEMHHLQIIGELIVLLGGDPKYAINKKGKWLNWTPDFIDYGTTIKSMIEYDIKGEVLAINQYNKHIEEINDENIKAILRRIIEDEENHINILEGLLKKYE